MRDWTASLIYVSVFEPLKAPWGQSKGATVNGAAEQFPQSAGTQELTQILFDLVDGLRQATSLTDVNVAAGIAWNALLGLEVETLTASRSGSADPIELAAHGTDELGQVLNLPL